MHSTPLLFRFHQPYFNARKLTGSAFLHFITISSSLCKSKAPRISFFKREGLLYLIWHMLVLIVQMKCDFGLSFSEWCYVHYLIHESKIHMVATLLQMFNWMLFLLTNPRSSQIASGTATASMRFWLRQAVRTNF